MKAVLYTLQTDVGTFWYGLWDTSAVLAPSGLEKWKGGAGHRTGSKHAHKKEANRLADNAKQDPDSDTQVAPSMSSLNDGVVRNG